MIVDLFGYQSVNKGQEMMFHACREFLQNEGIDGAVSVTAGSYRILKSLKFQNQYGLKHLLHVHGDRYPAAAFLVNSAGQLLPARFKNALNLVTRDDVDIVFDFSGFQYSDQWGRNPARLTARSVQHFRPKGKKYIYLPQSFGPFEDETIREYMRIIADSADLIFAREESSYHYLVSVCGRRDAFRIAPDFTNLVQPIEMPSPIIPPHTVFIIPNARMLDKTDLRCRDAYLPFLAKCARYLRGKRLSPVILLHEAKEDIGLAKALMSEAGFRIPIVAHGDPRVLKGYLKRAFLVVGSRYHALVSSLSQAVPTVATGWTHKYAELLNLYQCKDSLVAPLDREDKIFDTIDAHIEDGPRREIIRRLNQSAESHRRASLEMWNEVRKILGAIRRIPIPEV